jgi:PHD/YefM family antitoxin component YafN of YafNO toxin-antitoxin module
MNLVSYQSLIPSSVAIQPHLAWLLATVPDLIEDPERSCKVREVLEELNVKYSLLSGKIIDLESRVVAVNTEDILIVGDDEVVVVHDTGLPAVVIVTREDVESLKDTEKSLRAGLAEVIVSRGEAELEVEAQRKIFEKNRRFAELYSGIYTTVGKMTDVLVRRDAEADDELAAELAEDDPKETLGPEHARGGCPGYVPDIDLDGNPLD